MHSKHRRTPQYTPSFSIPLVMYCTPEAGSDAGIAAGPSQGPRPLDAGCSCSSHRHAAAVCCLDLDSFTLTSCCRLDRQPTASRQAWVGSSSKAVRYTWSSINIASTARIHLQLELLAERANKQQDRCDLAAGKMTPLSDAGSCECLRVQVPLLWVRAVLRRVAAACSGWCAPTQEEGYTYGAALPVQPLLLPQQLHAAACLHHNTSNKAVQRNRPQPCLQQHACSPEPLLLPKKLFLWCLNTCPCPQHSAVVAPVPHSRERCQGRPLLLWGLPGWWLRW
jgi:hypothetical protein